jgi:hypothetical protein
MPFLNVIKNFVNSEKAVAAGVLVIAATVFVFTNRITVQEWMDYTEILLAIYVGGKAVQGAASAFKGGGNQAREAAEIASAAHSRIVALEARFDETDEGGSEDE